MARLETRTEEFLLRARQRGLIRKAESKQKPAKGASPSTGAARGGVYALTGQPEYAGEYPKTGELCPRMAKFRETEMEARMQC
jgi:hypothetical protein